MLRRSAFWLAFTLSVSACGGKSTGDPAPATGGSSSGTGGSSAGTGGALPGVGGAVPGVGGAGAGGAPPSWIECDSADDCTLFADCCRCGAVARSADPRPSCQVVCIEDACTVRGVVPQQLRCVAGRCIVGYDCKSSRQCAAVPPNCSRGQIASGREGCWGPCIDAFECAEVDSCAACDSATTVCMQPTGEVVPSTHCVEVPPQCLDDRSCACLGSMCEAMSAECIQLGDNTIGCDCPTC